MSYFDAMMDWLAAQPGEPAALARDNLLRLEMTREALAELQDERNDLHAEVRSQRELLLALGTVLDVAGRACRNEATARDVVQIFRDTAPFKNLMATMYGLDEVGGELPKRRRKAS